MRGTLGQVSFCQSASDLVPLGARDQLAVSAQGGLPGPELCWELTPRDAGAGLVQSCVDDRAYVSAWPPAARAIFCVNDVLDPAPLLICESLIVRLEALGGAATGSVAHLAVDSHGFDYTADDGAFGALGNWFNIVGGVPGQGFGMLAGQFHSPGGAAVDAQ